MKSIYMDYAAATPMSEECLEAMSPYFTDLFFNPSATYLSSRSVRENVADFRSRAANCIGARPAEIIFTSGATEANNLAVLGVANRFPKAKILVSSLEHSSVLEPAAKVGSELIPALSSGVVDVNKLNTLLTDKVVLVSVMLVNNETGCLQPINEIAQLIEKIKKERIKMGNKLPIYLHTDAAQAPNYLDLHISRLGVDMMSLNGGKIYGPKGVGVLYVKAGTQVEAQILGGHQEFGVRSGTENTPSIAGMTTALLAAQSSTVKQSEKVMALRHRFESELLRLFDGVVINGGKRRAPHISSVTFPGVDNETLMMQLDESGVQCAVGSACSASNDSPSSVLKAMGLSNELARSTLRFSFGKFTTEADIDKCLIALKKYIPTSVA